MKLTSLVIATTVAGILGLLTMQGASAGQVQVSRLKAATTTPVIEATTGTATFVASGLPHGTAYLEWFKDQRAWVKVAKLAKKGTKGSASTGNLPAGINKFRVTAQGAKSSVMVVRVYQIYNKSVDIINFGTAAFGGVDYYFTAGSLSTPARHGCDYVDVGMNYALPPANADMWATMTVYSDLVPPVVVTISSTAPAIAAMKIPVKGDVTVAWDIHFGAVFAANGQVNEMYTGLQAHCLSDPNFYPGGLP